MSMRLPSHARAIQAGIFCIGYVIFHFLWKLSEDAVLDWANYQIADSWEIATPSLSDFITFNGARVVRLVVTDRLMGGSHNGGNVHKILSRQTQPIISHSLLLDAIDPCHDCSIKVVFVEIDIIPAPELNDITTTSPV